MRPACQSHESEAMRRRRCERRLIYRARCRWRRGCRGAGAGAGAGAGVGGAASYDYSQLISHSYCSVEMCVRSATKAKQVVACVVLLHA